MKTLGKIGLMGIGGVIGFITVVSLFGMAIDARTDYIQESEQCLRGATNGLEIARCGQ